MHTGRCTSSSYLFTDLFALVYKDLQLASHLRPDGFCAESAQCGAVRDAAALVFTIIVNWNCSNLRALSFLLLGASSSPTRTPSSPQAQGVWGFGLPFVCIWERGVLVWPRTVLLYSRRHSAKERRTCPLSILKG